MKRRFASVSAAAIAVSIAGSVAAAPVTAPTAKVSPTPKPSSSAKPNAKGKSSGPKLSKWQQHVASMLKVSAPGDEYFGRMKMSYLGINNTFHDELIRAGAYTTDPGLVAKIEFADEALVAWSKKYPNDPQLARSYFLAFQIYRKVWVQRYQDKAWDYAHIVVRKWPSSFFGKTLQKDLKIGFTEHYFAVAVACPEMPEVDASATPNRHATPTPSPTPTPEPTATPSPAPGRPPAQVLPVPCFTPSPAPTIAPVVAPSGTPAPIPSGSLLPSPAASGSASPRPGASVAPVPSASVSPSASSSPGVAPTPLTTHKPRR